MNLTPDELTQGEPLSVADAARQLGLSRAELYRMVDKCELPAFRFGRAVRVPPAAVREYKLAHLAGAATVRLAEAR